jgi:Zn-dependent metalloprotease
VRRVYLPLAGALLCAATAVVQIAARGGATTNQPEPGSHPLRATEFSTTGRDSDAAALATLRSWDQYVTAMERDGSLARVEVTADARVPGRTHERLAQRHRGVRVFGGELTRQRNGFGQTVSLFGTVYDQIAVDPVPLVTRTQARAAVSGAGGGALVDLGPGEELDVELVVLPTAGATGTLTWMGRTMSPADGLVYRVFVDARTGTEVHRYMDTWTQLATSARIGLGVGVYGDQKKVSSRADTGRFTTVDLYRPGSNRTYDMLGDPVRATRVFSGQQPLTDTSDLGADTDNNWDNAGAVVDAHVYAGFTYDYYFRKFGRQGLSGTNVTIRSIVNPARPELQSTLGSQYPLFFNNAAYYGSGYIAYGVGAINTSGTTTSRNFATALDIVAHELTHGVTGYSSRLIYQGESGALNEAFSDIMGICVEFANQNLGSGPRLAEWHAGEDVSLSGTPFRNFVTPTSRNHPDHYSVRYLGDGDNGGVHINSSIANHAFYLAVMGGTNRVSGLAVSGVGFANLEQMEQVFFRAFTQMLTPSSDFAAARTATVQAARDLYGANSAAERAVTQAWTAVGVQ